MSIPAIILCQAPADVPYVLTIYENMRSRTSVHIYVINVEGIYSYLKYLKLNVDDLEFIPYELRNPKKMFSLYCERKRIKELWQKLFSHYRSGSVYFFSRYEDWLTAAFIHRFSVQNAFRIYYVNHYDSSGELFEKVRKISLKRRIYLIFLNYLTDVNFVARIKGKYPEFPICQYRITEIIPHADKNILSTYYFKSNIDLRNSNILFFIGPCENCIFDPDNYDNNARKIFHILKDMGFKISIKGHPRVGMPKYVDEFADYEIPCHIPGELIDATDYDLCLGVDSTAICHFAEQKIIPTYSLMKLFKYSDRARYDIGINYLRAKSRNELLFVHTYEELSKIGTSLIKPI